jgi:cellulose synthase/poly-beta-1,6-N-acetylglucosamine synthase-like glycosyltransferase
MKVSVEEYVLTWNSQFGFILIDNKTMAGKIVSDSEALKLSKTNVCISMDADKRMDEILGFKTYGKTWRNINIDMRD